MKKNILTAAVLTAALALGTAPAFAEDLTLGNVEVKGDTKAGTTVSVETTVSQIDVSLPLAMTISAPTAGGATTVPSGYKIVNKSIFPIKVSNATVAVESGWKLTETPFTGNPIAAPSSGATIGDLQLSLTPTGKTAWQVAAEKFAPTDWTIDAASGDTAKELPIALSATNSKLAQTFDKATKAVTITYTIEANNTVVSGS